jgi:proline iminopeptidase
MKKALKVIGKSLLVLIGLLLILFLIFYLSTNGNYEVAKTVEQDPSIPHIKIENTVFHAETFGNDTNEVVIVLHGGPGNDFRYLLSLKALADEYFVVFYDQRGTGLSPRVNENEFTMENMMNDLNNIIDYYAQGRKVNLIGHSWGAMLASSYIGKYPSKVDQAVLAEPGILTSEEAQDFMEKMKVKFSIGLLKHMGKCWFQSLHVKGPDDQAAKDFFLQAFMLEGNMKGNPYAAYYCDEDMTTASFDYWRFGGLASSASFRNAMDEDGNLKLNLVDGVENFNNKVLFIASECNSIIGEEQQKDHINFFPNAELIVIKNTGHTMFGEQPEESLKTIRKYFNTK